MPGKPSNQQGGQQAARAGQLFSLGDCGIPLRLIRSPRRTLALEVRPGSEVLLRSPLRLAQETALAFAKSREKWILKHFRKPQPPPVREYTQAEEACLRQKARETLPPLVAGYAKLLGVTPGRITITGARTRFGSCSRKGSLSFSFRLMAYPEAAIAYVALHEAAHLKQLNHSPAFYALLDKWMPDHRERAGLLKRPPESIFPLEG